MSKPLPPGKALDNLVDLLSDEALAKSDQEIRADTAEEFGDVKKHVQELRDVVQGRVAAHKKARLAQAQAAVQEAHARNQSRVSRRALSELKATIRELMAKRADIPQRLTLAFRNGEGISDQDWMSLAEDLEDLGFLSEDQE